MSTSILESVNSNRDLTALPEDKLPLLAEEIRKKIIETVAVNGGHLGANLGVVELTIALERCFDPAVNPILWDVGHQAYTHKLLTGRRDEFDRLRRYDGISGFPSPDESACDAFVAGHAGNAISAACGISTGRKLLGNKDKVIAVVGDASISCGISLEALNETARDGGNLLIVLNDNSMAISGTVGGVAHHLNRLISSRGYNRVKDSVKRILGRRSFFTRCISGFTNVLKLGLVPSSIFEALGIRYFGPIDGHNINEMTRIFRAVADFDYPVLVHVVTQKGRGFQPAVENPERYHGVSGFDPVTGAVPKSRRSDFSACFGRELTELAGKHPGICAITAGMPGGTGLKSFAAAFPERFFDVGIAEEHAAIFASGLAKAGMKPFLALYSTFAQRAFDCFFHDISLNRLPVTLVLDRAGAVEDGPTHHGIRDVAMLRNLGHFTILAPADDKELVMMMRFALESGGPVAIRYPRGTPPDGLPSPAPLVAGRASVLAEGDDCAIWALGPECATALAVRGILAGRGISARCVNTRFAAPFDREYARECLLKMPVFTIEDHMLAGGLYSMMCETSDGTGGRIRGFGWREDPGHGKPEELRRAAGLDAESIAEQIAAAIAEYRR